VDLVFNRGPGGFTSLVQTGLNQLGQNVAVDGGFGPKTLNAMQSVDPVQLVRSTEAAYRAREAQLARNNPDRMKLLPGINNRSTKREAEAIRYIQNYYASNVNQGPQVAVGMGIRPTGPIEGTIPFAPEGSEQQPRQEDEYTPRPLGLGLG
jgi:lysozyme family protein